MLTLYTIDTVLPLIMARPADAGHLPTLAHSQGILFPAFAPGYDIPPMRTARSGTTAKKPFEGNRLTTAVADPSAVRDSTFITNQQ